MSLGRFADSHGRPQIRIEGRLVLDQEKALENIEIVNNGSQSNFIIIVFIDISTQGPVAHYGAFISSQRTQEHPDLSMVAGYTIYAIHVILNQSL